MVVELAIDNCMNVALIVVERLSTIRGEVVYRQSNMTKSYERCQSLYHNVNGYIATSERIARTEYQLCCQG
jgi:hypothetical protein